jgi:hypothetical protein
LGFAGAISRQIQKNRKKDAMHRGTCLLQFLDYSLGIRFVARLRGAAYHLDRQSPTINSPFFLNGSAVDSLTADPSFKADQALSNARTEENLHDYLTI